MFPRPGAGQYPGQGLRIWRGNAGGAVGRAQEQELSVAYHAAAADTTGGVEDGRARRLLRGTVAARQRLADTEEALSRLTAGSFGRCEECATLIPDALLRAAPESRYCAGCDVSEDAVITRDIVVRGDKVATGDAGLPADAAAPVAIGGYGHR